MSKEMTNTTQSDKDINVPSMQPFDVVYLTHDVGEKNLKSGEMGAIVEVYKDGAAYEVEFVNSDGTTKALLTLTAKDITKAPVMTYTPSQLEEALYHATDIAGRALLPFMLLGETAHDIKYYQAFKENHVGIEIGANKRYLTAEALSTLRTISRGQDLNLGMQNFIEDEKGFNWTYHKTPIRLKIIKWNYSFLQNPDFVWYKAEEYHVPNPFNTYWKARHLVQ